MNDHRATRRTRRLSRTALSAGLLLTVLATACGGSGSDGGSPSATGGAPPASTATEAAPEGGDGTATPAPAEGYDAVFAAIDGLEGDERTAELRRLAEAEGNELMLYTSMNAQVAEAVAAGFNEAFDIHVELYRSDQLTLTQRIVEEVNAGVVGGDVAESSGLEMVNKWRSGVLVPYTPPYADELREGSVYDGWIATRLIQFVMSWNTDNVAADEVPTAWEDLADDRWNGRIALEAKDVDWYKLIWEHWVNEEGKTPEEADELFRQIAEGARVQEGHSSGGELVAAGELDLFTSNFRYIVERAIDSGAPVAWEPPVEPIAVQPNGVGMITNAAHPAAALLFVDWLLSPEGQQLLVDHNLSPTRLDVPPPHGELDLLLPDLEAMMDEFNEWEGRYNELLRLAG